MAVDKERKRGGLIIVDPRHPPSRVECRLVPLIRVHGRVRVAATGKPITPWDRVYVGLPFNEDFPLGRLRLEDCASVKSRFEFWLPPGDYRLEAFGPDLELTKPRPIRVTAGQHEVDCGVLDLSPILEYTYGVGSRRPKSQEPGAPTLRGMVSHAPSGMSSMLVECRKTRSPPICGANGSLSIFGHPGADLVWRQRCRNSASFTKHIRLNVSVSNWSPSVWWTQAPERWLISIAC
jgi:hypothetical protein